MDESPDCGLSEPTQIHSQLDKHCRLLELKPEIRTAIIRLAVAESQPIKIHAWQPLAPIQPALLATCHEIRSEALPIFYNVNTFRFVRAERATTSVDIGNQPTLGIKKEYIKLMKKIELAECICGPTYRLDLSYGLAKYILEVMYIQCDCFTRSSCQWRPKSLPREKHALSRMGQYLDSAILMYRKCNFLTESLLRGMLKLL